MSKARGARAGLPARLRRALLCALAVSALVPGVVEGAAPAPEEVKTAQSVRTFDLVLPLVFQDAYLGDVPVAVGADGKASVNFERFVFLLGPRLTPEKVEALKRIAAGQAVVPIDVFAAAGITTKYDPTKLELHVAIPVDSQGGQTISAFDRSAIGKPSPATVPPERFSGSLTLTARETYIWDPEPSRGWEGLRIAGDLALNAFGPDGVYLFAQGEYDADANAPFRRGNVLLFHDEPDDAIRYSLGDITLIPAGLQGSPIIGGVAIERLYGEIQPYANIRPAGLRRFTLDHTSTVDVVVNGVTVRTLRLDPGQYDLRDFPLFNGLNNVDLYVVDEFGRRLIASFSLFYSARLLDAGITEFGAALGALQESRAFHPDEQISYDGLTFSGYVRHGLTNWLTIGANLQATDSQYLAGTEIGFGTPIGNFGILTGFSDADDHGSGWSALFSYELQMRDAWVLNRPLINVEYLMQSRDFTTLDNDNVFEVPTESELRARATAFVAPLDLQVGLSASRIEGRDLDPDESRAAISFSKYIGFGSLSVSYEHAEIDQKPDDDRFLLTFTASLSDREIARASYDSHNDLTELSYTRFQTREVDDVGIHATLLRDNDQIAGAGELSYNANRFWANVEHDVITDGGMKEITSQQTSVTVATQLAFAGDDVAIGRPVGPRFAIVSAHETLDGHSIGVKEANGLGDRDAETDALGPALVSASSAYRPQHILVDVENLPEGYDFGSGQYDLFPGPASGYAIQVGSNASRIVRGVLVDEAGKPLGLLGGEIRDLDDKDFKPVLVFTNSSGRFVAEGLAPGRYQMTLGAALDIVVPLEVPEGAEGVIDIGTVRPQGGAQ